jgi:hypothetical protein
LYGRCKTEIKANNGPAQQKLTLAQQRANITEYIRDFARTYGDYMPHPDEVHLPCGTMLRLHKRYNTFCISTGIQSSSYQYFRITANADFGKYVKIRQLKVFSKCETCDKYATNKEKANDVETAKEWGMKLEKHNDWQHRERQKYYRHRYKSIKYLSLIMDAMDQQKTEVLRLKRYTQASAKQEKVQVSVVGVISHGHAPHVQAYLLAGDYPKDSSLTCQVLAATLKEILAKQHFLPPTLYLQLDNTSGQNKNSTLLLFLRLLVKLRVFDKVSHTYAAMSIMSLD